MTHDIYRKTTTFFKLAPFSFSRILTVLHIPADGWHLEAGTVRQPGFLTSHVSRAAFSQEQMQRAAQHYYHVFVLFNSL